MESSWQEDAVGLSGDQCYSFYSFLWTKERSITTGHRAKAAAQEVYDLKVELLRQLSDKNSQFEDRKRDLSRHEGCQSIMTIGANKIAIVCSLEQFESKWALCKLQTAKPVLWLLEWIECLDCLNYMAPGY